MRVRRMRNIFPGEMYLRLSREDINKSQESTNQETIDINKLRSARGFEILTI